VGVADPVEKAGGGSDVDASSLPGWFRVAARVRGTSLLSGWLLILGAVLMVAFQVGSERVPFSALMLGWALLGVGVVCASAIGTPRIAAREVGLPVRGRWRALNSPADRAPSHRTHAYGQTFAIDLLHEPEGATRPRGFLRPDQFPGFGKEIVAPADGRVVIVRDRARDRRSRSTADLASLMRLEGQLRQVLGGGRLLAGNTIVLDLGGGVFASLSHLKRGSARVKAGEHVRRGDVIALCGNSGNSSEPHLHFQLMDHPRQSIAAGLPITFFDAGHSLGGIPRNGDLLDVSDAQLASTPSGRPA